jgi:hypothetical protein
MHLSQSERQRWAALHGLRFRRRLSLRERTCGECTFRRAKGNDGRHYTAYVFIVAFRSGKGDDPASASKRPQIPQRH